MTKMKTYFARIDRNWCEMHRRAFYEDKQFAVMFENKGSTYVHKLDGFKTLTEAETLRKTDKAWFEKAGYNSTAGPQALGRLRDACKTPGALVYVEFYGLKNTSANGLVSDLVVRMGRATGEIGIRKMNPCGSCDSCHQNGWKPAKSHRYKTIQLVDVQDRFKADPVLAALRPPHATFVGWHKPENRLNAIFSGKQPKNGLEALIPGQLEVLCFEWLRERHKDFRLLLPVGRTLPDIDVYGWLTDGTEVAAQVTHLTSGKRTVENKLAKLKIPKADLRYLFAGKEALKNVAGGTTKLIAIEDVFKEMNKKYPDYVQAMYPNTTAR